MCGYLLVRFYRILLYVPLLPLGRMVYMQLDSSLVGSVRGLLGGPVLCPFLAASPLCLGWWGWVGGGRGHHAWRSRLSGGIWIAICGFVEPAPGGVELGCAVRAAGVKGRIGRGVPVVAHVLSGLCGE